MEWRQDQANFPLGTAPCNLPADALMILGSQRFSSYQEECARRAEAAQGCPPDCRLEAGVIEDQILAEWQKDGVKFPPSVRPCNLPPNSSAVLGQERVLAYAQACAAYTKAADAC
jgi:hypothetical protein